MSEPQGYTQAFVEIMNSKLAQDILNAFAEGEKAERERILELTKSFWCGEPDCTKHGTNWVQFIALIKGENNVA